MSPPGPLSYGPQIYQSIGVEPVINCRGTITIIGATVELPAVRKAMEYAAQYNVQLDELAMAVGQRLSELTGAEWGMASAGCAAGLKHVTAACVSGGDPEKLIRIPNLEGFEKTEVISPVYSRNFYDHAMRNIGVKFINVDTFEELQNAISSRTALIYLMSGSEAYETGPMSLERIAKVAGVKNIPILVDAAAEAFTVPNVHLQRGATIVAYSGGKQLCGPQCAGLLLGKKDILLAAWQASAPHHGPGRDNKLGREEHIGVLAAVEEWVTTDHAKEEETHLLWLENISKRISGIKSVTTAIRKPQGLNNRSSSMTITWDPSVLNITGEEVAEDFARNKPRIAIGAGGRGSVAAGSTSISLNATFMQPGNDKIVADRIYNILSQKHLPKSKEMAAPSINFVGHWDIDIQFFIGKGQHKIFIEKQEGNWVQGSHKGSFSLQGISGTIEGNQVKLMSTYTAPGDSIPFIFAGNIEDDTFSGTLYMGEYRTATFTAKRADYLPERRQISLPNYGRRNPNAW